MLLFHIEGHNTEYFRIWTFNGWPTLVSLSQWVPSQLLAEIVMAFLQLVPTVLVFPVGKIVCPYVKDFCPIGEENKWDI